eukprot:5999956-Pleurochrysis_carterae.AAC.1
MSQVCLPILASLLQAARLREETEAPFAKLRLYLWPALLAAAGLATYFGATSLLAEAVGARQPAEGTAVGLAIDLAAVAAIGLLWRNDLKAQDARLRRISAGARLAALRVRLPEGDTVAPLSELRVRSRETRRRKHNGPMGSHTRACTHAPTHALAYARMHAPTRTHTHARAHAHAHTQAHAHAHAHLHTRTHTRSLARSRVLTTVRTHARTHACSLARTDACIHVRSLAQHARASGLMQSGSRTRTLRHGQIWKANWPASILEKRG